jgi:hypothetical protein
MSRASSIAKILSFMALICVMTLCIAFSGWGHFPLRGMDKAEAQPGGIANPSGVVAPVITDISPASGEAGDSVTIDGQYFGSDQGDSLVSFGDVQALEYTLWSNDSIIASVPEGVVGNVQVAVTTLGGISNTVDFNVLSVWYLAEGYTGGEFDTWVLVQNPGAENAEVTLTFQLPMESDADSYSFPLPAGTRKSIHLDELPGLSDTDVSTKVSANKPVVAERAMYFSYHETIAGGHDSIGVTTPADTWYLAEGYTGGEFDTWVLVQNPGVADAMVTLDFQLPPGSRAEPYSFILPGGTRESIHLDELPGLEETDVSTRVTSDGGYGHGVPVVAERAMYFNYQGTIAGGHDSIGVTTPADTWYLAEGYTGGEFDTWVLVQNPGSEDATVTLDFQLPPGSSAEPYSFILPGGTRESIHLDELDGLEDTDVSTRVSSNEPVVAERAMYFDYQGTRAGGHDSIGTTSPGNTWYLAEGYTGGEFDTWVLVQNPGTEDAQVTLTFQLPPGRDADPYSFTLPAGTRESIHLDELVGLEDTDISTKVGANVPVVAERAMYFIYDGRAGGHDSIGYSP